MRITIGLERSPQRFRFQDSVNAAIVAAREDERLLSILAENQNNVRVVKLRKNGDNGRLEVVPVDVHERGFDII